MREGEEKEKEEKETVSQSLVTEFILEGEHSAVSKQSKVHPPPILSLSLSPSLSRKCPSAIVSLCNAISSRQKRKKRGGQISRQQRQSQKQSDRNSQTENGLIKTMRE